VAAHETFVSCFKTNLFRGQMAIQCLDVISLNVGGGAGVWRAVDHWLSKGHLDVLCLQEAGISSVEVCSLRARARRLRYRTYLQLGVPSPGRWGTLVPGGGVAVFVKVALPQREAFTACGDYSQIVGIWVGNWLVSSAYFPRVPCASTELGQLVLESIL